MGAALGGDTFHPRILNKKLFAGGVGADMKRCRTRHRILIRLGSNPKIVAEKPETGITERLSALWGDGNLVIDKGQASGEGLEASLSTEGGTTTGELCARRRDGKELWMREA